MKERLLALGVCAYRQGVSLGGGQAMRCDLAVCLLAHARVHDKVGLGARVVHDKVGLGVRVMHDKVIGTDRFSSE